MKSEQGFTLIELVIVLALMVIVSNVAFFSFSLVEKQKLNQSCIQLKSDLRYAQRMAITENRKYTVDFDIIKNRYIISYKEGTGNFLVKAVAMDSGARIKSTSGTYNSVTYTGMGATGDPCTITLQNDTYMAELTVNLGVGRVKLTAFEKIKN